jgi:hypothetical protein
MVEGGVCFEFFGDFGHFSQRFRSQKNPLPAGSEGGLKLSSVLSRA